MMRAIVMTRYGGNEVIEVRSLPEPVLLPDEVMVEVYAAGVNPIDIKIRNGKMRPMLNFSLPLILGNDIAGKIVRTGSRVTRFKEGDEVYASLDKKRMGAFAEYVAVAEKDLALKPKNLSFEEAASLPIVALTVYQVFREITHARPGQKIFIKAGSGGVGTFAIQFAKAMGLEVATTTSTQNVEWVRALGADHVIDYKKEKFENILGSYDIVLDSVDGDDVSRGISILKPGGHIIAAAGPPDAKFARAFGLNPVLQFVCYLMSFRETWLSQRAGVNYSFMFVKPSGSQLAEVAALLEQGKIRPVVDHIFNMEDVRQAFSYVAAGRTKGKVVLKIRP